MINGGNGSVDYNGTVTHGGTSNGNAIQVLNKTGGTVDFDGAVTSNGASDGISLGTNTGATINFDGGLVINTSTSNSTGFSATAGGTVNVTGSSNSITSGTGTALDLNGVTVGTGGINFLTVNNSGGLNGVLINTVGAAGANGIAIGGGAIVNASNRGVDINATSANVSVGATISTTAAGRSVEVTDSGSTVGGGNTIVFSGAIDENGTGINLNNNDQNTNGATINFTGGLDIDPASGSFGFSATNGGTINITGVNTIDAVNASALVVTNTNIGASDLTFQRISSSGGSANGHHPRHDRLGRRTACHRHGHGGLGRDDREQDGRRRQHGDRHRHLSQQHGRASARPHAAQRLRQFRDPGAMTSTASRCRN